MLDKVELVKLAMTELPDSLDAVNDHFYQQGWTDGLPIIPPTRQRVDKMLDGMRAWRKEGKLPAAIDDPELCSDRWSGHVIVPNNLDMLDAYRDNIPKDVNAAA